MTDCRVETCEICDKKVDIGSTEWFGYRTAHYPTIKDCKVTVTRCKECCRKDGVTPDELHIKYRNMYNDNCFYISKLNISKDDIALLHKNQFYHTKDDVEYFEFMWKNNYTPTFIFNRESINEIITALKNGCDKFSDEIQEILNKKFTDEPLWEFNSSHLRSGFPVGTTSEKKKRFPYAKDAWAPLQKRISLLETNDDHFVVAEMSNGTFSNGRVRKLNVYTSKEILRDMAIQYIDDQIQRLTEFKNTL